MDKICKIMIICIISFLCGVAGRMFFFHLTLSGMEREIYLIYAVVPLGVIGIMLSILFKSYGK